MDSLNKIFVDRGIYQLKQFRDNSSVFLCEALQGNSIGKLVVYKETEPKLYERTDVSYFLNAYYAGDLKELFIKRDNYDMIGMLQSNYVLSEDKKYLLKA